MDRLFAEERARVQATQDAASEVRRVGATGLLCLDRAAFGLSPRDFGPSPGLPGRAGHVSASGFGLSPRGFGLPPSRVARNHRDNTQRMLGTFAAEAASSVSRGRGVGLWMESRGCACGVFVQKARWISG